MSKPPRLRRSGAPRIRKLNQPNAKPEAPVLMGLGKVPEYLKKTHGITVSRVTVYNWANKGKRGTLLASTTKAGHRYTTKEDVDAFVAALG